MTIIVTGGAGFIGSNFVLEWLSRSDEPVINIDKLTYAGNLDNLTALSGDARHVFLRGDIADRAFLNDVFATHRPRAALNFAAESHVDRSISSPSDFIDTNIVGTFNLLEVTRQYLAGPALPRGDEFRFLHVSTDEVYGSLGPADPASAESAPYAPNSPYSASKAASDHLVRAYHHTYGLPTLTTNCSNNYGPYQNPEKLIPLIVERGLRGEPIPIYGDGLNMRDWLYVGDHCAAIRTVLASGRLGETYNIGGNTQIQNVEVARTICALLDRFRPATRPHAELITFVSDRLGHDRRYAVDTRKIETELGWRPVHTFATGIEKTVRWYVEHDDRASRVAARGQIVG